MIEVVPLFKITSDLISSEIIKETSKKIYSSLYNINNNNIPIINNIIENLDIQNKIKIVNSLFEENKHKRNNNTQILSLNNLHDISEIIEKELNEIQKQIEYNNSIYLSYFLGYNYSDNLNKLRKHCNILDNRLDLAIKLLCIN